MAFARKGFFQAKQTRGSVEEIGQSSKKIRRSYRPIDGPFPKSFLARTKHTQYRRQTLSVAPAHFSPFVISSCYVPYAVVVPRKFLFLLCFSFSFPDFCRCCRHRMAAGRVDGLQRSWWSKTSSSPSSFVNHSIPGGRIWKWGPWAFWHKKRRRDTHTKRRINKLLWSSTAAWESGSRGRTSSSGRRREKIEEMRIDESSPRHSERGQHPLFYVEISSHIPLFADDVMNVVRFVP